MKIYLYPKNSKKLLLSCMYKKVELQGLFAKKNLFATAGNFLYFVIGTHLAMAEGMVTFTIIVDLDNILDF